MSLTNTGLRFCPQVAAGSVSLLAEITLPSVDESHLTISDLISPSDFKTSGATHKCVCELLLE